MFNSTRKKIAVSFTLFAGSLLIAITLITIFLIRLETERQARQTLEDALQTVVTDFNTQNLKEKSSRTLSRNSVSYEDVANLDQTSKQLPNILDKKIIQQDKKVTQEEIANIDLSQLKENRTVYSRVILPNGGILFSSDLFEQLNVDTSKEGFFTLDFETICIHTYTAKINSGVNAGSIVQVGQYCPFSYAQQRSIFLQMIGITFIFLAITYLLGLKIAGKFLKPMQKAAQQTREFAENCYHELLTPLTVAMTTVDATKHSRTYEKGIESLDEDLKNMYYSLQTLHKNALVDNSSTEDTTNISECIMKLVEQIRPTLKEQNGKVIAHITPKILKKIDSTAAKIIFQNILVNAAKYAASKTTIEVTLDSKKVVVKNSVDNVKHIDVNQFFIRGYRGENAEHTQGNGFGLAIVRELCEMYRWKVEAKIKGNDVILTVTMN